MIDAIWLEKEDNVVTVVEHMKKGDTIEYLDKDENKQSLEAKDDIRIFHKVAIKDIPKGDFVLKYGEHIGVASEDIKKGQHVHQHNTESRRENLEAKE